ncbi:MAG: hypothetical protein HZB51_22390 [Chloroflexi bacterium]|nr:hypothetical protein [Chloroflexota bacterium]
MILAGVAGLLMKRWLSDFLKSWGSDSMSDLAYSYWGNLTISFAVYFLVSMGLASHAETVYKGLARERGEVDKRGSDFLSISSVLARPALIAARAGLNRVTIAVIALLVVEGFEFTNGFGIMTNVYDPFDYLANALGVALAYFVDVLSARAISVDRVSS